MAYQSERGNFRLAVTGDSLVLRDLSVFAEPEYLELVELIRSADAGFTGLETIFHNWESAAALSSGSWRTPPHIIDDLGWMGFNLFGAANNHATDYGERGLIASLENLEARRVTFAGVGRNLGEARAPHYLETPNGRVALISVAFSLPSHAFAQHQTRDNKGRPGANMIRYSSRFTVDGAAYGEMRRIAEAFNLVRRELGEDEFAMADLQDQWHFPLPNGYRFARGDRFGIEYIPDESDVEENLQRIFDARRQADYVVVSMHAHEWGASRNIASGMAIDFSHRAVDAGADVICGNGPNATRGMEIYKGRPIIYSSSHFIHQSHMLEKVAYETFENQGLDPWTSTPADSHDARAGKEHLGEEVGMFTNPGAWQGVVAMIEFADHQLSGVTLHPIELGFHTPRSQRGRPMIAHGEPAEAMLTRFRDQAAHYGTKIELDGDTATVLL
jgi:poly-gamma-glutamate capsule biosynthesis protein CapA/YwtB (metallophosphatase superfamily)